MLEKLRTWWSQTTLGCKTSSQTSPFDDIKPGTLIHYKGNLKFRFCPVDKSKIENVLSWEKRIPVDNKQENCILLFVESLDFSKETTVTVTAAVATATWAAWTSAAPTTAAVATATWAAAHVVGPTTWAGRAATLVKEDEVWKKAREEFKETGKIPGGIFLTGNGKLIWVSHYDQKELMKPC